MLNIEKKYKEILENKYSFAVSEETGEVLNCSECNCDNCKFCCANNGYEFDSCEEAKLAWLFEECKEPLLTEDEKEFLKTFVKLFGLKELKIKKYESSALFKKEYLKIEFGGFACSSPYFTQNRLFKGLKLNEEYSLKDLGLDE